MLKSNNQFYTPFPSPEYQFKLSEVIKLHRILQTIGSKEVIKTLSMCRHTISYHDIRMQNIAWSRMVSSTQFSNIPNLRKGIVTHNTIDNKDGRQETMTGKATTHDTNMTVFHKGIIVGCEYLLSSLCILKGSLSVVSASLVVYVFLFPINKK